MSQPYHGNAMDRPPPQVGSVRRARERAMAGLPRDPSQLQRPQMTYDEPQSDRTALPSYRGVPSSKVPKPRAPIGIDGNINQAISRPTPIPQWPLAGPLQSPVESRNVRPFRPPQGQAQDVPQRPPRPSVVPSLLDQSRVQEPMPVFLAPNTPADSSRAASQDFGSSQPATPSSRLTVSSVGSIPDFPVPATTTTSLAPPRRSVNLGPPPSSRRGLSSYYSTASYVSPIPEESAGSRSHGSYASSAAMPDTWGQPSPATSSTFREAFYEESISDDSRDSQFIEDYGDESSLVRSASVGKKGKPSIITTGPATATQPASRPGVAPIQPAEGGDGEYDVSTSSSNTLPTTRPNPTTNRTSMMPSKEAGVTPATILGAYAAATAPSPTGTPPPQNPMDRIAARRPPKLDIDAVRAAEARGSLTSLPDLIRRATTLAAMIDRGKRPASRFEELGDFPTDRFEEKEPATDRRRSGLSDMLAAFPPPAQATREPRPPRGSWFRATSWPLVPGRQDVPQGPSPLSQSPEMAGVESKEATIKPARRCCGLPMWAFILVVVLILAVIAVAIVIPLQFFVFKTLGNQGNADQSLEQCKSSLVCKNGGTNVITQGVCSCICTNGFSGPDCTGARSDACTTTNLVSSDASKNIQDVTLGRAIPRLIADASANFSIPLSGTTILAKLNSGSLSCIAQNSLVTFNRQSTRVGDGSATVQDAEENSADVPLNFAGSPISVITLHPGESLTINPPRTQPSTSIIPSSAPTTTAQQPAGTTTPPAPPSSLLPPTSTNAEPPASTPSLISTFSITEEMLDFGRVAVLFVLQEQTADAAVTAQTNLQRFFSEVQRNGQREGGDDKRTEATSLAIGGNNRIDLIGFTVDLGNGPVGRTVSKRTASSLFLDETRSRRGGSSLPRHNDFEELRS